MKTKVLILGLICLLMVGSVLYAEKKHINFWQKLFTEPVESIYFIMKDGMVFKDSAQSEIKIEMSIEILEERLKSKNYTMEEIAIIIHNHRRKNYFTRSDYSQHRMLKKYGFNGFFLMYCHRTNKTYDIENKEKSK